MAYQYQMYTLHHHSMYDMASMLQKSIRRADIQKAGYAAYELFGSYHTYMWKRLIVSSAEDCYGIITKEIIALKLADDQVNAGKKGYDKDPLFAAKSNRPSVRGTEESRCLLCGLQLHERCKVA